MTSLTKWHDTIQLLEDALLAMKDIPCFQINPEIVTCLDKAIESTSTILQNKCNDRACSPDLENMLSSMQIEEKTGTPTVQSIGLQPSVAAVVSPPQQNNQRARGVEAAQKKLEWGLKSPPTKNPTAPTVDSRVRSRTQVVQFVPTGK